MKVTTHVRDVHQCLSCRMCWLVKCTEEIASNWQIGHVAAETIGFAQPEHQCWMQSV